MNLIPVIKSALSSVAPTAPSKYRGKAQTYISFFEYLKQPEAAADNETAATGRYWQIDLWSKEKGDAELYDIEQQIESNLKAIGFSNFTVQNLYEKDTEIAHYAIRCYFYEEE